MRARALGQSLFLGAVVVVSMVLGGFLAVSVASDDPPAAVTGSNPGQTTFPVSATQTDAPSSANGAAAIPDLPDLVQRVSASVVRIGTIATDGILGTQGVGAGIVLDKDGHILTNYHVVEGATELDVELADGTVGRATVVGVDPGNDLAVMKTSIQPQRLVPAVFGDSDATRVGEPVFAIGNPFSLSFTVTSGIISGLARERPALDGRPIRNVIQTDAAVNPGNSGGPLFNDRGEVIGINTSIENPTGQRVFVGIGFAVPSNTAQRFIPQLIRGETVSHPQLGIAGVSLNDANAVEAGVSVTQGVYVTTVSAGSAAAEAGLRAAPRPAAASRSSALTKGGDVITAINGEAVSNIGRLAAIVDNNSVGDRITLSVVRDGRSIEVQATLREWQGS